MSLLVPLGKAGISIPLIIKDEGGQLVNADSAPVILNVQKNGSDSDESAVTIAQAQDDTPANITGFYNIECDLSASGLNATANDTFSFVAQATVNGTLVTDAFTFTVADLAGNSPSISLGS